MIYEYDSHSDYMNNCLFNSRMLERDFTFLEINIKQSKDIDSIRNGNLSIKYQELKYRCPDEKKKFRLFSCTPLTIMILTRIS